MLKQLSILLFLLSFVTLVGQSNEGTEFWLAFMEHRDVNANAKVVMITSKYDADFTLSIPGLGVSTASSVKANEVRLLTMPLNTEVLGSERIQNLGIKVQSTLPVSVYVHQYANFRSEAAVILPTTSIGKEYYTLSFNSVRQNNEHYPSQFIIIGTKDQTAVKIHHNTNTIGGRKKADIEEMTLNTGEVYQVQASDPTGDISGAYIEADKNIVVLCGAKWIEIPIGCGTRDNLIEMLAPVNTWGKQFVSAPTSGSAYDKFRIIASEANTNVNIETSKKLSITLTRGEIYEFDSNEAVYFQSNKPIQIAQYLIGNRCSGLSPIGDPSMLLLNSIEQTRDTVTLFNSSFQAITSNFINVIMRTVDIPTILFDGAPIESFPNITKVPANPKYSYVTLRVQPGPHTIIAKGCGVVANAYGYGDAESYAYSGGANYLSINANPIPLGSCVNTEGHFDTGLDTLRYHHTWKMPDNTTLHLSKFEKTFNAVGTFPIDLYIKDSCLEEIDSFQRNYQVTIRQALQIDTLAIICQNEDLFLSASDISEAVYTWEGPKNYKSEEQSPSLPMAQPDMSGEYKVVGSYFGCPTLPSIAKVTIHPLPDIKIEGDTLFCQKKEVVELKAYEGLENYLWSTSATSSQITVNQSGSYGLVVIDKNGCENSAAFNLFSYCPPSIFTPNVMTINTESNNNNRYFHPIIEDVISSVTKIYDRWGNLVFQTIDNSHPWDGSVNGNFVETGVYTFMIEYSYNDENQNAAKSFKSGNITIVKK
jgi:gliding motility-associated-like protein